MILRHIHNVNLPGVLFVIGLFYVLAAIFNFKFFFGDKSFTVKWFGLKRARFFFFSLGSILIISAFIIKSW